MTALTLSLDSETLWRISETSSRATTFSWTSPSSFTLVRRCRANMPSRNATTKKMVHPSKYWDSMPPNSGEVAAAS